ncbi:MAG TPA: autotransporter-associated beta strand repeat-containing protein [Verrucomicrobiae bacterium]|nr:autotransporter-associated beta strand repeat-containing protein [Verrucomicrobiae bacterium]
MYTTDRLSGLPGRLSLPLLHLVLIGLATTAPAQLTTNDWVLPGGGLWTNAANWDLNPDVPDSNTEVALFTNDYAANFTVTQNVNVTINGLIYEDTGTVGSDAVLSLNPMNSSVLTFDGTNPFLDCRSSLSGGAALNFNQTIDVGSAGFTKIGYGTANLAQGILGSGNITISQGILEVRANNTNFMGQFIVNSGGTLDFRAANANALGSTNVPTVINGTGQLRLRDLGSMTMASEPVTINGFNPNGSIRFYASSNVTFNGPITLNTNGVLAMDHWYPTGGEQPGGKKNWIIDSVISDDGNSRNVYFYHQLGGSATGTVTRTSEFFVGGASTYGGKTYITANRAPDGFGPYTATVRLTNGNDRLPTTTTVFLGGLTNGVGHAQANGRLILNGYNQEVAGLVALGTGVSNSVVGGQANLSTLTLNIAAGVTNRFTGFLGGPDLNDNNLALISKGPGILDLAGANTYTGTTTVTNGTLRVNGTHIGGGNYSIQNGGTLGGTGLIDAAIHVLDGGFAAPGNPIGTLTTSNNFILDGTLQIELANGAGPGAGLSDMLDVNGFFDITNGTLQFVYTGSLTNDVYIFAEYDSLSGPFGTLTLPDGYGIDYQYGVGNNQIALFVIPEPSTLALLGIGLALTARLFIARRRVR